jgi:hypothetical protein
MRLVNAFLHVIVILFFIFGGAVLALFTAFGFTAAIVLVIL